MFTLITGPMKSGKSLELIAQVEPYQYTDDDVIYVQPEANVRDSGIQSRLGVSALAHSISSLHEVKPDFQIIGIDEIHMFDESDSLVVDTWLKQGKNVIASGLDIDYRRKLMPIVARLLELKPDNIINKLSVCDSCHAYKAQFTQILHNSVPILEGLPPVVPEDGTYQYEARCRDCFVN